MALKAFAHRRLASLLAGSGFWALGLGSFADDGDLWSREIGKRMASVEAYSGRELLSQITNFRQRRVFTLPYASEMREGRNSPTLSKRFELAAVNANWDDRTWGSIPECSAFSADDLERTIRSF